MMQTGTLQSKPLHGMFTAVPRHYDIVNRLVTWGLDERWRREAARECLTSQPERVLDLCCGTGDLAIQIARMAGKNIEVTGIDYSQPMLEIARKKAERPAMEGRISFIYGDVSSLPFPDGYFDCVGISFAFRNLTYRNPLASRYLAEVSRVLNDGGRFVIVETSQPGLKPVRELFHLYLRWFVFWTGYLISGNRGAYHYLSESAARFYNAEEVGKVLLGAGLRQVSYRPLLLGATGIHVAVKVLSCKEKRINVCPSTGSG